ncbi:uncharacterized protein [Atheta coriaria]|uniref:uncharacterized protein n=1 Tax=Dalotia coriaria TaxID=877792 RepID=UPI0031F47054
MEDFIDTVSLRISAPSGVLPKKRPEGPKFQLTEDQKKDMKEAFDIFDWDGTGRIDVKEVKVAIRALGFEPPKEEMKRMIAEVDTEDSGKLSYENFITLIAGKMCAPDSKEELLKAFRLFDAEQNGYITTETLLRVSEELGEYVTEEEIVEMIDEADVDEDGRVTEEEFVKFMRKITFASVLIN